MTAPSQPLAVPAGPGLPTGLVIPADELIERFSRSSGPGGQSVNTTDSRVALRWDIENSGVLSDAQRSALLAALSTADGAVTITASEFRSQLANRRAARARLAALIRQALVPALDRRPSRPSRAARQRRLDAKRRRAQTKAGRSRPDPD